jgi:hypothetical protein
MASIPSLLHSYSLRRYSLLVVVAVPVHSAVYPFNKRNTRNTLNVPSKRTIFHIRYPRREFAYLHLNDAKQHLGISIDDVPNSPLAASKHFLAESLKLINENKYPLEWYIKTIEAVELVNGQFMPNDWWNAFVLGITRQMQQLVVDNAIMPAPQVLERSLEVLIRNRTYTTNVSGMPSELQRPERFENGVQRYYASSLWDRTVRRITIAQIPHSFFKVYFEVLLASYLEQYQQLFFHSASENDGAETIKCIKHEMVDEHLDSLRDFCRLLVFYEINIYEFISTDAKFLEPVLNWFCTCANLRIKNLAENLSEATGGYKNVNSLISILPPNISYDIFMYNRAARYKLIVYADIMAVLASSPKSSHAVVVNHPTHEQIIRNVFKLVDSELKFVQYSPCELPYSILKACLKLNVDIGTLRRLKMFYQSPLARLLLVPIYFTWPLSSVCSFGFAFYLFFG